MKDLKVCEPRQDRPDEKLEISGAIGPKVKLDI